MTEIIWTEKYRPKIIDEVVGQREITKRIKSFVEKKSIPHCLFSGPAGVGKTTLSICIANELFGEGWKNNFLELNASDERGIDTVRVKIKDFARTMALNPSGFKIIYLDEADSLTMDAQQALRRTMEKYSETARFILACNYSSKIISPIKSRTAIFSFSKIDEEEMKKFLEKIIDKEGIEIDNEAIDSLLYISQGDMRKAVNILQTAAITKEDINKETIFSVTSRADPESVKKICEYAISGNFNEASKMLKEILFKRGLAGTDVIKEIYSQILTMEIDDKKKVNLLKIIGEYEFRLTEGSNPQIQLDALLANMGLE